MSDLNARLRAAVEAALPDGWHVIEPGSGTLTDCDTGLRQVVLAAVAKVFEDIERENEALRAWKRGAELASQAMEKGIL